MKKVWTDLTNNEITISTKKIFERKSDIYLTMEIVLVPEVQYLLFA